jgi:hypothetical protein
VSGFQRKARAVEFSEQSSKGIIEEFAMDVWGFLSVVAVCVTIALAPLVWSNVR